jgi:hypothetical protein
MSAAVVPRSFHRFLDLPAEIRLVVWKHALGEYILEVQWDPYNNYVFYSAVLCANWESRSIAHPQYNHNLQEKIGIMTGFGKRSPVNEVVFIRGC